MEVVSISDIALSVSAGQQVGSLRRTLEQNVGQLFIRMAKELHERELDIEEGLTSTGQSRRAAWDAVLQTTSGLASAHDLLNQLCNVQRRAEQMRDELATSLVRLRDLSELPGQLVPEDLRARLGAIGGASIAPVKLASMIVGDELPLRKETMRNALQSGTRTRLLALHAILLGAIADAVPDPDATTSAAIDELSAEANAQVKALREAARKGAKTLLAGQATPAFAFGLWEALLSFEQWLETDIAPRLADACAVATGTVIAQTPNATAKAREAGKIYDILRTGLAFDAGVRAVLMAYAVEDTHGLSAFASTADLPLRTATLDLPRTTLGAVPNKAEGELIEIDGLITDAEFRVGPPSNRSILTLGQTAAVRVLIPHVAVNSFGIGPGTWVQIRGEVFPDGKDGIAGPVVMVGRIARSTASEESFTDALIFAGRAFFQLRPGELEIVASRVAGQLSTLAELGRANT